MYEKLLAFAKIYLKTKHVHFFPEHNVEDCRSVVLVMRGALQLTQSTKTRLLFLCLTPALRLTRVINTIAKVWPWTSHTLHSNVIGPERFDSVEIMRSIFVNRTDVADTSLT